MTQAEFTVGIIGGNGMLGSAIARGLLDSGVIQPEQLGISSRSGNLPELGHGGVRSYADSQALADASDFILLSVPPANFADVRFEAGNSLVSSVMAGVTIQRVINQTGTDRVIRAMSSPAASLRLAFSPWCASPAATDADKSLARTVFAAVGATDEVPNEDQIDLFTAVTGPVPGFVAQFAASMVDYSAARGVDPKMAERAVRQLFHAAGVMMADGPMSPADHVKEMIDYAGTTAAGLLAMQDSDLDISIAKGLDAAYQKARRIG